MTNYKDRSLLIEFSALDSLYFRGTRPHAAAGASALESEFPPPVSTLSGAIRTRLGDSVQLPWRDIREQDGQLVCKQNLDATAQKIMEWIGTSEHTGALSFGALQVRMAGEPLYPAPSVLLSTDSGLVQLELGEAVECDLGTVRLPQLPAGVVSAKPLDSAWITEQGLHQLARGEIPAADSIYSSIDLFEHEPRLGIARNNRLGTVESGMLFQTAHLRLRPGLTFAIEMTLPEEAAEVLVSSCQKNPLQRFGGEGRLAEVRVSEQASLGATALDLTIQQPRLWMLMTDMLPEGNFAETPLPGFQPARHEGTDCWEGELGDYRCRILSVAAGKPRPMGGWDIRHNRPRPVQQFVPAGTCFWIEPVADQANAPAPASQTVGRRQDYQFGLITPIQ